MKKWVITGIIIAAAIIACAIIWLGFSANGNSKVSSLSEEEARAIAEKTCIKGGEALDEGIYNENSKTWWFDANLNSVRDGCNPACVVDEASESAEINWRCTGLIVPNDSITNNLCTCPQGYRKDGGACNPECYYSNPPCLAPSVACQS